MHDVEQVPYECVSGDKYKVGKNPLPLSERHQWAEDPTGTLSMLKWLLALGGLLVLLLGILRWVFWRFVK